MENKHCDGAEPVEEKKYEVEKHQNIKWSGSTQKNDSLYLAWVNTSLSRSDE
jgi:hypothetical protein